MRLRPSGNAGPLAVSLPAFRQYHAENAWTWERMALTRARAIVADPGLGERIDRAIADILSAPRDATKTIEDVVAMRALMQKERPPRHSFDLKLAAGGLVDLEFIAQSAQLVARTALGALPAPVPDVLRRMEGAGLLVGGGRLADIHAVYATILQVMSAALVDPFREDGWTPAFRDLLAQRTNMPSFERLEAELRAMQAEVSAAAEAWYAGAGLEQQRIED
jgi:[glutamine synthetase] adenylyltransferase / [glutamine synthetase]-adenylyl-L-tyrosine phosphorylase